MMMMVVTGGDDVVLVIQIQLDDYWQSETECSKCNNWDDDPSLFKPLSCWEAIEEAPSQSTLLSNLDLEPIQLLTFLWSVTCSSFQTNDTKAKYIEDKKLLLQIFEMANRVWKAFTSNPRNIIHIQVIAFRIYVSNTWQILQCTMFTLSKGNIKPVGIVSVRTSTSIQMFETNWFCMVHCSHPSTTKNMNMHQ